MRAFGSESDVTIGFLIKNWARGLSFGYVGHWPQRSLQPEIQPSPSTPYIRPRGSLRDSLRHSFFLPLVLILCLQGHMGLQMTRLKFHRSIVHRLAIMSVSRSWLTKYGTTDDYFLFFRAPQGVDSLLSVSQSWPKKLFCMASQGAVLWIC